MGSARLDIVRVCRTGMLQVAVWSFVMGGVAGSWCWGT